MHSHRKLKKPVNRGCLTVLVKKKPMCKRSDELLGFFASFLEKRFITCQHDWFYFKTKDIFEYNKKPRDKCEIEYKQVDVNNLGVLIQGITEENDGIYKDIYTINTYLNRKRSKNLYIAKRII